MAEAQLVPYDPTLRERSTKVVAKLLRDHVGMDNYESYDLARGIMGDENASSFLESMGLADFTPAGAIFGGQEGARMYQRSDDLVGKGLGAGVVGLSALEAFPMTALMAKGVKRMFPKGAADDVAPDLEKRKTIQGIAALPVMATGAAKVLSDLPVGAVTKAAKAVPNMTGSKILDNLPFIKNQLAPVFNNVVSNKSVIDFEASYDPLPPTPGNIPRPRSTKVLKEVTPENRVFQAVFHLDTLKTDLEMYKRIYKSEDGSPIRTLSDIDTTNMRTPLDVKPEDVEADVVEAVNGNILADFVDANRNLPIDDAIAMLDKEGFDVVKKAWQSGSLKDAQFLRLAEFSEDRFKNIDEYKKFLDDYFENKKSGSIENIRVDLFGEDAGGYALEEQFDIVSDMAEELYLPNQKLKRALEDGQMSPKDYERLRVDK